MAPGPIEEIGKVTSSALDAMKSTPLAVALLIVNIGFLLFTAYILQVIAASSRVRAERQDALILELVKNIQDCRSDKAPG